MNLDPEVAAAEYRERMVGPYRGVLPDPTVRSMEEQLSGSCTMEIAAFDEFSRLLGDPEKTAAYNHVLFDTAPTGHTLRLLSLPQAWSSFLETNSSGTSCLGPLAGLAEQRALYEASVRALGHPSTTLLVLVSRPEVSALREAERSSAELRELGVTNQRLVLNGVFTAPAANDPIAVAFDRRAHEATLAMPSGLAALPRQEVALSPKILLGVAALRSMFDEAGQGTSNAIPRPPIGELPPPLMTLVDELEGRRRGVIMTMGKGGVGKTTVAAAVALELARRGHKVHLSTTDPAAHVGWVIENPLPGLQVGRIDAEAETRAYREEVMRTVGEKLDEQGRALLGEDLRSPCTEEVAVFRTFARTVAEGQDGFVVLDTAPTGHTILLLDAAEAYHREVLRQSSSMPETVRDLLPRLRDPEFTSILLITLPEATPVHEAARLQSDLGRAGITPFAWVINQSLSPLTLRDPVLKRRQANEQAYIREVTAQLAGRTSLIPWLAVPPTGQHGLLAALSKAAESHV